MACISRPAPRLKVIPNPEQLGLTEPNDAGRRHPHGTLSACPASRRARAGRACLAQPNLRGGRLHQLTAAVAGSLLLNVQMLPERRVA
jgi:hypothetical protein